MFAATPAPPLSRRCTIPFLQAQCGDGRAHTAHQASSRCWSRPRCVGGRLRNRPVLLVAAPGGGHGERGGACSSASVVSRVSRVGRVSRVSRVSRVGGLSGMSRVSGMSRARPQNAYRVAHLPCHHHGIMSSCHHVTMPSSCHLHIAYSVRQCQLQIGRA